MSAIYLDNAATTQISPLVLEEMMPYLRDDYGNPSSNHSLGIRARKAKEAAREKVASLINADPDEIFFTSGATEANNWILSALHNENVGVGHIIVSNIEHNSVVRAIKHLTNDSYMVVPASGAGEINYRALERRFCNSHNRISLLSVMMANNETGVINDIKKLAEVSHARCVPIHTDATQAIGHMKIDVKNLNVDALSGSAHKIYGPKGVGFLYVNSHSPIYKVVTSSPLLVGGHQESDSRAGTENIAGIVGLGSACLETKGFLEKKENEALLRKYSGDMLDVLVSEVGAIINCDESINRIPTLSLRIPGVNNHELCQLLDEDGVCVSAGSACNENSSEPSHVLSAMGLKNQEINETIRISIGRNNTESEIKTASEIMINKINTLRMFSD